jgi:thiol-disulfide isomerase/thioredoxin
MKKARIVFSILVGVLFMISSNSYSQPVKIPPFQMIQANGELFKAQDLPMGKPIVIIYFSPDCEECQKFTEAMLSRMDDFWKSSIAMITYLPVPDVAQYVSKYKLNIYPNIFVGTEGNSFIVRYYFNIKRFPFVALFNKNGDLIKIWDKEENIDDLSKRLKAL